MRVGRRWSHIYPAIKLPCRYRAQGQWHFFLPPADPAVQYRVVFVSIDGRYHDFQVTMILVSDRMVDTVRHTCQIQRYICLPNKILLFGVDGVGIWDLDTTDTYRGCVLVPQSNAFYIPTAALDIRIWETLSKEARSLLPELWLIVKSYLVRPPY